MSGYSLHRHVPVNQIGGNKQRRTVSSIYLFIIVFIFVYIFFNHLTRKLGNQSKPLVTISQEGEEWTFKQESLVKTSEVKFSMGKQFEEVTADGRKVLTTNSVVAPNTLLQEMLGTGGGKDSVCTREFTAEKMKCVCSVDDIVTTRWYQRQ